MILLQSLSIATNVNFCNIVYSYVCCTHSFTDPKREPNTISIQKESLWGKARHISNAKEKEKKEKHLGIRQTFNVRSRNETNIELSQALP